MTWILSCQMAQVAGSKKPGGPSENSNSAYVAALQDSKTLRDPKL